MSNTRNFSVQYFDSILMEIPEAPTEIIPGVGRGPATIITRIPEQHEVKVSTINTGRLLISREFGPCISVVAQLKNGDFVQYHASNPSDGAKGYKKFIDAIKNDVESIYLFQKKSPPSLGKTPSTTATHAATAPILARNLARDTQKQVYLIGIPGNYKGVVCDSSSNRVLITDDLQLNSVKKEDTLRMFFDIDKTGKIIPPLSIDAVIEEKPIQPIQQEKQEKQNQKKISFFKKILSRSASKKTTENNPNKPKIKKP